MRTDKTGDARGRPRWRSSFVGDPGAIFLVENGTQAQNQRKTLLPKKSGGRSFYFCISSLAEPLAAARSGQGRAAVQARRSVPLTARTAAKAWAREEKTWCSGMQDLGKTEEQG
jgi:hypothetical protein